MLPTTIQVHCRPIITIWNLTSGERGFLGRYLWVYSYQEITKLGDFFHFLFIFTQTVTSWPVFLFKTQYRDASDNFISDVQYFLKSDLYFIEICTAVVKKGIQPQTRKYDVNIYPTNFIPDYDFWPCKKAIFHGGHDNLKIFTSGWSLESTSFVVEKNRNCIIR